MAVLAAAMVAVLVGVTGGGAVVGSAVVARHRAQAAADLAAVAAAAALPAGVETACGRAARVVRQMRGDLVGCSAQGLDVVVTVEVAAVLTRRIGPARAAARAGPPGSGGRGVGVA